MKIVVLIPCYNGEITIGKVITDFKRELPQADMCIGDKLSNETYKKENKRLFHEFTCTKRN